MVAGDLRQGGATWAVLQYVLGLRRLGHDVMLVEPVAQAAVRPHGSSLERSLTAQYFSEVAAAFELDDAALVAAGTRRTVGRSYAELERFARTADLLLNVSGMLTDERLLEAVAVRAYLDLDPCFNQLWELAGDQRGLDRHTHFVSVGQALGHPSCSVPTCGRDWIAWLPPVVLAEWPVAVQPPPYGFTTVGHWRSYGPVEHEGVLYGQKVHSVRALLELPRRSAARFQPALAIHPGDGGDRDALLAHGWDLLDPGVVASDPDSYRRFIGESQAELGVAKSGYVASGSGWFSDRSACYLASGRPVLAQETGFGQFLPTGEGLLSFATTDEAAAGAQEIVAHYDRHAAAARALAEEHFDSDRSLPRLLDRLTGAPVSG